MKRSKRILAVLLTAVLTFTILTGCGGGTGSSASYPSSSTAKNAVVATLKQAGFSASPHEQSLNAISEKYAKQVARSPESYSSYGSGSPLSKLQSNWISDCKKTITSSTSYFLCGLSPYMGSNSEGDATSYYARSISSSISHFEESTSGKDPGTSYYYIYPVHITNPSDPEDSVWLMFTILYLVKN